MNRIENRKLLDSYHNSACVACGETQGTHAHHVRTKGAGGDDVPENLIALCFFHHRMIHDKGTAFMAEKFFSVFHWLTNNGWVYDKYRQKWSRSIGEQDED